MTTSELISVFILSAIILAACIAIAAWYIIQIVNYVKNEQKEANEEAKGGIDPNAFEGDFVEAARRQMNF